MRWMLCVFAKCRSTILMRVARLKPHVSRPPRRRPGLRLRHASRSFPKASGWRNAAGRWSARSTVAPRTGMTLRMKPSSNCAVMNRTEGTWSSFRSRYYPTTEDRALPGVCSTTFCGRPKKTAGRRSCCCASRNSSRIIAALGLSTTGNRLPRMAALSGMKWPGVWRTGGRGRRDRGHKADGCRQGIAGGHFDAERRLGDVFPLWPR